MDYVEQLENILIEPKIFFKNFGANNNMENENDLNEKAIEYREGLRVMETALNELEKLKPQLLDISKHSIIKNSFRKNTEIFLEIVKLIDLDVKNMGSQKVSELVKQIKF